MYWLESPDLEDYNECIYTIILWQIEKTSHPKLSPIIPPDLALWLTVSGKKYPCLEQISIVKDSTVYLNYFVSFLKKRVYYK